MKTCIAVYETGDDTRLAFLRTAELYQRLSTAAEAIWSLRTPLTGAGSASNPYVIDSFPAVVSYIDRREKQPRDKLYFNFFGEAMYQKGNVTDDQDAYYIGLQEGGTLSYPAMREEIDKAGADAQVDAAAVKQAFGVAARNKYELLAVACLMIAEGKRDRLSLVTHLLLFDLVSDEVTYGSAGTKTRTLGSAIDKGKSYTGLYAGVTAAGDSPMSQKNAVDHVGSARSKIGLEQRPNDNRYYDKTVSLLVQWIVRYYGSKAYELSSCSSMDEFELGKIDKSIKAYGDAEADKLTFSKNTKSSKIGMKKRSTSSAVVNAAFGLKNQVLSEVMAMLQRRITAAVDGKSDGFTFTTDATADTKTLKLALAAT